MFKELEFHDCIDKSLWCYWRGRCKFKTSQISCSAKQEDKYNNKIYSRIGKNIFFYKFKTDASKDLSMVKFHKLKNTLFAKQITIRLDHETLVQDNTNKYDPSYRCASKSQNMEKTALPNTTHSTNDMTMTKMD